MSQLCPCGRHKKDLSSITLTDDHIKWFTDQLLQNLDTKASLVEKYNLKPHILQTWKDCVRKGISFPGKKGRPALWDSSAVELLSDSGESGQYQIRSSDFHNYAQKLRQETCQKRNRDDPDTLMPSRSTMRRLDKKLGIRDARAEALLLLGQMPVRRSGMQCLLL